eukprot:TRINITY_DN25670_c0_g1_i1.p1 TRINITY_DN25670_c0_g1~~TRINITY_DN25670_c0_g1_i1.p1  ORF type:complete len:686 (-),score=209.42 TRINITY_DN25670_c0_g1_i1:188-2161(-)
MATAGPWGNLFNSKGKPLLSKDVLDVIVSDLKFKTMTPVQSATLPLFMQNKDVAVEAVTGSGKTLAFVVPILEILMKHERDDEPFRKDQVGAIVITPIRELAVQIHGIIKKFLVRIPQFTTQLMIGGENEITEDLDRFRQEGGTIIVATPGRLEYVLQNEDFNVKALEILVMDEADRLLDMGFAPSINAILEKLPKLRRTGLFSATQTSEVKALIRAGLRNPVRVAVKVERITSDKKTLQIVPKTLDNFYTLVEPEQKLNQLVTFLSRHKDKKFIVYFLTCACVDYFYYILKDVPALKDFEVVSLHGKVPADLRGGIFKKFTELECGALITTDVASRGLDIPDVDWVVQFDAPQNPDVFVHRVGRTARIGRQGNALLYLYPNEDNYIEFLKVKKIPLQDQAKETDPVNVLPLVRQYNLKDRRSYDRSRTAFVSFIRGYKEHHCGYIFRLPTLNIGKIAEGFGLLDFPRMPELKDFKNVEFVSEPQDVIDKIPYKNKQQEKKRKELLEKRKQFQKEKAKRQEEEASKRPEKKVPLRQQIRENQIEREMSRRAKDRERELKKLEGNDSESDEGDEFEEEERLYRQFKRGNISKSEYEAAIGSNIEQIETEITSNTPENVTEEAKEETKPETQKTLSAKDGKRKRKSPKHKKKKQKPLLS